MVFPNELIFPFSIIIVIFIFFMMKNGYKDGFLLKLCDVVSFILCILLTSIFADEIANYISVVPEDFIDLGLGSAINEMVITMMNYCLVYLIVFAVLRLTVLLVRPLLKVINWIPIIGSLNKFLGVFMGFIHSLLVLWVVCFLFSSPLFINGNEILEKTGLIYIKEIGNIASSTLNEEYDKVDSMQKILHSSSLLEESDYENIKEFLELYGSDVKDIDRLIEMMKMRSE